MIQFFLGTTPAYHATGALILPVVLADGMIIYHPGALVPPATAYGTGTAIRNPHDSDDLPRDRAGYFPPELQRTRR